MRTPLFVFLIFLSFSGYSQQPAPVLGDFHAYPVRTISPTDTSYSDLYFLKDVLHDKRIVLLGEQTHGDGATFEAKIRLIKFLHREMGYSMLAFESGMYDNYKADGEIKTGNATVSPMLESVFGIWSDTKEFRSLVAYVHAQRQSNTPLIVSGFDCQEGSYFEEYFLNELKAIVSISANDLEILEQVMEAGPEFVMSSSADSAAFYSMITNMNTALRIHAAKSPSEQNQILQQVFTSWIAAKEYEMDELRGKEIAVQNPRDLQMAKNLIFLANLYPNRKIIAWGASYHFANKLEQLEYSPVTKKFVARMDSLAKSEEPTNLEENLKGAVAMGKILKAHFGDQLASISFSSYEGSYGLIFEPHSISLGHLRPPPGSLEQALIDAGFENAFVTYTNTSKQKFYTSALGNLPMRAPWQHIFDGHFFIKKSYPPSLPVIAVSDSIKQDTSKIVTRHVNTQLKLLVDAVTGEGVSFASVALANSSKGVTSNVRGEFAFHIPGSSGQDVVIISCIGYETRKIPVAELNRVNQIKLQPKAYELDAVEVRAKGLSARDIIKRAAKRIKENYYQSANQQELFYRANEFVNDSLMFSEEAAMLIHDPDGYRTTGSASKNLTGQILQFRNTSPDHEHNSLWSGVGHIWLMYTHDVILSKSNVLHRPVFYTLTLKGATSFDNKRVYEIDFDCKRPGAFTTGYGYPAPESATGKIFIDASTFAVLRYEMLVKRKPSTPKRYPHLTYGPYGHKLIQAYEEFEGKYFLKYSKQIMYANTVNNKNNAVTHAANIYELVATEINTQPVSIPAIPVIRIKSVPAPYDAGFWSEHNTVIEDDIHELYKELAMVDEKQ